MTDHAPVPAAAPLGRSTIEWARLLQAVFVGVGFIAPEWADLQDETTAFLATGLGLATAVVEVLKRKSTTPVADPRVA